MDENENLELNTEETIEETETENGTPDNTDNVDDLTVDDPTSDGENDEENENFFGNFKTKEDAENGYKSAQAKITEQANEIKKLKEQLNPDTSNQLPDTEKIIEDVRNKINIEFGERLRGLGVKYSSFMPEGAIINTIDDIVQNLPPLDAAKFVTELNAIQNDCNGKMQREIDAVQNDAIKKFEDIKQADKERYKDNEIVFNAWYNPPQTIEGVAELVENVRKQAIEDYIKEQAASQEDNTHKNRLTTTANTSNKKYNDGHIFTRKEIDKMSMEDFAKFEAEISRQVAAGLVG